MRVEESRDWEAAFRSAEIHIGVIDHKLVEFVNHREVYNVDVVFVGGVTLVIFTNVRIRHFLKHVSEVTKFKRRSLLKNGLHIL